MKSAIQLVIDERYRQIAKGFTPEHDLEHTNGELTAAAQCYATVGGAIIRGSSAKEWTVDMFNGFTDSLLHWPWQEAWFSPDDDARTNLVKACALLLAEIDRIQRAAGVPLAPSEY